MTWWGEAGARSLTGGSVAFTRRRKWRVSLVWPMRTNYQFECHKALDRKYFVFYISAIQDLLRGIVP